MSKRVAIVGAGAAGLACAITAARAGAAVTLFEAKDRIGSTILATGNGRCNISNANLCADDFYNPEFVAQAFDVLPSVQVHQFFGDLGLLMREEGEGRMYPLPNKASAVLDVLRFAIDEAGVEVLTGTEVVGIKPAGAQQLLKFGDGTMAFFDKVVVSVGGGVAQALLPTKYPFNRQRKLLCGLRTDTAFLKGLDNIRVRCQASLVAGKKHGEAAGRRLIVEEGEVQFRDYGISGVAVFNLSRFAQPGDTVCIDFLPDHSADDTREMLRKRLATAGMASRNAVEFLSGVVLPAVARNVLKMAGLDPMKPVRSSDINALTNPLRSFAITVNGFQDKTAQVSRGGFAVESFNPTTMESLLNPGVYVVGEALDVDGPCGGFNLHWAWTSGILAGRDCAKEGE